MGVKYVRKITMEIVMTRQSAENMEYVRRLLKQKQPGFAAVLELAADLVERELSSPEIRLVDTFAFLERMLGADFSACGDPMSIGKQSPCCSLCGLLGPR
jgi:hypothetical protein